MSKNKKGALLYIPTIIYIIIFEILIKNSRLGYDYSLSLFLAYFMPLTPMLAFFWEFLIFCILLYAITKKIFRKIPTYKENTIFPAILVVGYLWWAIPVIDYAINCSEKFCSLLGILPLSFLFLVFNSFFKDIPYNSSLIIGVVINSLAIYLVARFVCRKRKIKNKLKYEK